MKIKKDQFDKMAKSITDYMEEKGWKVIVIGSPKIYQPLGSLKYNFELTFRFTGKKLCQKKKKKK